MATLTDEEKVTALLGGDGDTTPQPGQGDEGADAKTDEEIAAEAAAKEAAEAGGHPEPPEGEKPPEEGDEEHPAEAPATFTKKFSNLKGDDWEAYGQNLEEAYQNSFTEALRLSGELQKKDDEIAQLRATDTQPVQGQPPQGAETPGQPVQPQAPNPGIQATPEFQWLQSQQTASMRASFGKFMEAYPQVKDEANFDAFKKAITPVTDMYARIEGRQPTYEELFPKVADVLGWQPEKVTGTRAQQIKDATSQNGTAGGQGRVPDREPPVSDAELTVFMRMTPGMSRADAVKEIAKIKGDPMAFTR